MEPPAKQPQPSLGTIIDAMETIRRQRAELATQDKELRAEYDILGHQVLAGLDAQNTTMTRAKTATAVISEEEVAQIDDWDAVFNYIHENGAFYLLQRRFNNAAWRELKETEGTVPGTSPLKIRKIALRKL